MMFIIAGIVLVCVVVLAVLRWRSGQAGTLGSMSERWLAENRASRH